MSTLFIQSHHLLKEYFNISEKIILKTIEAIDDKSKTNNEIAQSIRAGIYQLEAILNVTRFAYGKKVLKRINIQLLELKESSDLLNEYDRFNELLISFKNITKDQTTIDAIIILNSRLDSDFNASKSETDYKLLFKECSKSLIKYKKLLKDNKSETINFTLFKKELKRIYCEGQEYLNLSKQEPTIENVREWSRSVKNFHFLISTLTPIWEILFDIYSNEIKTLSVSLEMIINLKELRYYIQSLIDNPHDFSNILYLIDDQIVAEVEKSIIHGDLIYSLAPDTFALHLKSFYSIFKHYSGK